MPAQQISGEVKEALVARRGRPKKNGVVNGSDRILEQGVKIRLPKNIVKRDGRIMPFEVGKIERAIRLCFEDIKKTPSTSVDELVSNAVKVISAKFEQPSVEEVQDIVEVVLQVAGEFEAAKHYILYRAEHSKLRDVRPIPSEVTEAFAESDKYFGNQIQKFQFF